MTGGRVLCGMPMTIETVMDVKRQEKPYYGELGGVTFTGGEPMAQKEFVTALADACRAEGIHTAIETSMIFYDEAVLSQMDLIMADLKIWDCGLHRRYTGVDNEVIKENLQKADDLGVPIVLRTPVIPEISQQIPEIAAFARGLQNVYRYELLPYHPLGDIKRLALNQELPTFTTPTKEMMKEWNQYAFLR